MPTFSNPVLADGFVGVHLGLYGVGGADAGEAHVHRFDYAPAR